MVLIFKIWALLPSHGIFEVLILTLAWLLASKLFKASRLNEYLPTVHLNSYVSIKLVQLSYPKKKKMQHPRRDIETVSGSATA